MSGTAKVDIELVSGDNETIEIDLVDTTGAPIDITGRTYAMQVRTKPTGTGFPAAEGTCAVDGPIGRVTVTIGYAETDNLTPGDTYYWSLRQNPKSTLITGRVNVIAPVTKDYP